MVIMYYYRSANPVFKFPLSSLRTDADFFYESFNGILGTSWDVAAAAFAAAATAAAAVAVVLSLFRLLSERIS